MAGDAGDDGVAAVLAVATVPALTVVLAAVNVSALDAEAAVPSELAIAGVFDEVSSGKRELDVLRAVEVYNLVTF